MRGAEILVLDEPTAVLTPSEADQLFAMLRVLKSQNKTIVFITHKLREIMALTDRVSVMRRGEMVATFETARDLAARTRRRDGRAQGDPEGRQGRRRIPGAVVLEARGLTVKDDRGVTRLEDVSFSLRAGEIVGIAGVAGNGQSELLEALAGMRPAVGGRDLAQRRARSAAATRPQGDARTRPRPCAGGPPPRRPRHAVRGLRERDARLPGRAGLRRRRAVRPPRHRRRRGRARWRPTTSARARRC